MFDAAAVHPLVVHAPLVLLPIAVLFALWSMLWPRSGLRLAAVLLLLGGVGGAILAAETGEAAEHQAERMMPSAESISVPGAVPQTVANGNLLETHAQLGEMTRNLYGLLLLIEGGLLAASTPILARWRRGWTLSSRVERLARGAWMIVAVAGIVLVVLTGHYGGTLVYTHGVGVTQGAATSGQHTSASPSGTVQAGNDSD